jgi:hypothetical protein
MGWMRLGAVLYKMGKVRIVLYHKPQPNTNTHNNQLEPTPSYRLSLSMGRAAAPLNHDASTPLHHTQAVSHRACACCHWFARLGGQNERHQKIESGRGALALDGRRFINYTQQSNKSWHRQWRGSWEGHATGAERVGGGRFFALVVKLIDKN